MILRTYMYKYICIGPRTCRVIYIDVYCIMRFCTLVCVGSMCVDDDLCGRVIKPPKNTTCLKKVNPYKSNVCLVATCTIRTYIIRLTCYSSKKPMLSKK